MEVAKKIYLYLDHFEVISSFLEWLISLRGCEGEMWEWMEFSRCCLFVTFVVLTVDQQKQDSHVCWKNCTFPLILVKMQSRHYEDDEV